MKQILAALTIVFSSQLWALEPSEVSPLTLVGLSDGRTVLADTAGLTVYTFDPDTTSESTCYDGCARAWPPVLIAADAAVGPALGKTVRRDGQTQLTVGGKPVYLFAGDDAPGDINGDGIQGVWHIIAQ